VRHDGWRAIIITVISPNAEVKRSEWWLASLAPARLADCLGPGRRANGVFSRNIASCRLRIGGVPACLERCFWCIACSGRTIRLENQSRVNGIASPMMKLCNAALKLCHVSPCERRVYVDILLVYYLLSLQYMYRTPAIVNPMYDDGLFPKSFHRPSFPQNSAMQRAVQLLFNQMLRHPYNAGI